MTFQCQSSFVGMFNLHNACTMVNIKTGKVHVFNFVQLKLSDKEKYNKKDVKSYGNSLLPEAKQTNNICSAVVHIWNTSSSESNKWLVICLYFYK